MLRYLNICIALLILISNLNSQNRWFKNYLSGEDPFGESITEFYDKGYLLAGRYGPNYPSYCWLIKTDINGEVLWNKIFGNDDDFIVISADIATSNLGEIFLVGSTNTYSSTDYDPIVMKLDACGEKEWCKVFVEDGNNFSNAIEITPDGGLILVLRYMNPNITKDRICLAKLSIDGDMMWKRCYNSSDTNLYNQDAKDLTLCPDNGFLITGLCDYKDPNPPHYIWTKPYYIKTDSLGNFEWETVIHSDTNNPGGAAWSTVLSPDSNYFYSAISHYYYYPELNAPALVKLDLQGNIIDIYDIAPPDVRGKLVGAKFISDSTLMANASWGHEPASSPKAVIIDTLGNMINSSFLLDNIWMSQTEVTHDNKLLYFTNIHDGNDNFDTYLFKLNTELESDTIYTQHFSYDSLCPYHIISDTIVQNDCGLIVGNKEIMQESKYYINQLFIYPNPTKKKFTLKSKNLELSRATLKIFDLYGQKIETIKLHNGISEVEVNVKGWKKGLYLIRMQSKSGVVTNGKVMVQ